MRTRQAVSLRPLLLQQLRLVVGGQGVDDLVQRPVHHLVDLIQRQADAVVGDPALGEVVGKS